VPELLGEVAKAILEYLEWRRAPEEAASLLRALSGDAQEHVLYKGIAQYVNPERLVDTSRGVILVTDARFAYLAKKKFVPFVKTTERLVFPLNDLEKVEATKYRTKYANAIGIPDRATASSVQLVVNERRHIFLSVFESLSMKSLVTEPFATLDHAKEVALIIEDAKRRRLSKT
jgi:hypothetical protein